MRKLSRTVLTFLLIACLSSACLKTRAELKGDDDTDAGNSATAVPAKVTDISPQGNQYAIDDMKEQITELTGRVETLEQAQKQGSANNATLSKDDLNKLETRVVQLEQTQANILEAIKKLQDNATSMADPTALLEKGKQQYDSKDYSGAIATLDAYLQVPKVKQAQEATFLRAEAHYNLKEYKKAIVDYSKFPEKYTHSRHMAEALFKIGRSFDALGMHDDAKGFYQELIEKFPHSAEAKRIHSKHAR